MGADTYAALGAGFSRLSELFAQKLGMSMEEKRALAHEEAMQKREIAAEERALKRQRETPVERRVYQGDADQGPPLLMVDELNSFGEPVRQTEASPRERQEYQSRMLQAQEAKRIADEDRAFKQRPKFEERLFESLPADQKARAVQGKFGLLPPAQTPRAPSDIETRIALAKELGATPEQLQALALGSASEKASPERRETAKLDASRLKEAEDRARAAESTLVNISQLEKLMDAGLSTGPLDQYLPGRDRALFDSTAADLNLSTLRQKFGGNPTEGERAANAATLPGTQQYESNNRQQIAKIRADAEARIKEYQSMLSGAEATQAPPDGTRLMKDGKTYVVRNGKPVLES